MLEGLPQQILGGIRLAMVCFPQVAHMPVDNREAGHLRLGLRIGLTLPARIDIDTHERNGGGYAPPSAPPRLRLRSSNRPFELFCGLVNAECNRVQAIAI